MEMDNKDDGLMPSEEEREKNGRDRSRRESEHKSDRPDKAGEGGDDMETPDEESLEEEYD